MEIAQPKRILLLAPTGVSSKPVLDVLTTRAPPRPSHSRTSSRANASPPAPDPGQPTLRIANSYYRADIPIWSDEVLGSEAWAAQWRAEDAAAEVVRAVGAWVVCFDRDAVRGREGKSALHDLLTSVSSVIAHHQSSTSSSFSPYDTDTVLIAIAVPSSTVRSSSAALSADPDTELDLDLDDLCREAGNWEYINGTLPYPTPKPRSDIDGLDEFGETVGMERLLEALAGGEWDAAADDAEDRDDFDDDEDEGMSEFFKGDVADGFGELLAAGAASRTGLLGEGEDFACVKKADVLGGSDVDDDETWQVRGAEGEVEAGGDGSGSSVFASKKGDAGEWVTDDDVQGLQQMMLRLQAARDLGADLPAAERRKVARRAVREVMKDV